MFMATVFTVNIRLAAVLNTIHRVGFSDCFGIWVSFSHRVKKKGVQLSRNISSPLFLHDDDENSSSFRNAMSGKRPIQRIMPTIIDMF